MRIPVEALKQMKKPSRGTDNWPDWTGANWTKFLSSNGEKTYKLSPFSFGSCNAKPVVAPVVAGGKTIKWDALEPAQIIGFQRWWWGTVESDMVMEPGGVEGDECKAKYKSALCGGKPCIKSQAVDGKWGGNTIKLANIYEKRPIFEKWWNTGTNAADYGTLPKTCTSAERGYEKPPKQNLNPVVGGGGPGTGGGGAPFGGQYSDLF
jgi:hypothetical protein